MTRRTQTQTATHILHMAQTHHVTYVPTQNDVLAHHMSRLADNQVRLDETERTLLALIRAGRLSRPQALSLQARYLREAKS